MFVVLLMMMVFRVVIIVKRLFDWFKRIADIIPKVIPPRGSALGFTAACAARTA